MVSYKLSSTEMFANQQHSVKVGLTPCEDHVMVHVVLQAKKKKFQKYQCLLMSTSYVLQILNRPCNETTLFWINKHSKCCAFTYTIFTATRTWKIKGRDTDVVLLQKRLLLVLLLSTEKCIHNGTAKNWERLEAEKCRGSLGGGSMQEKIMALEAEGSMGEMRVR